MTSHYFDNGNLSGIINIGVMEHFHARGSYVFSSATVARAVVSSEEVIVDGFRNTHNAALVADLHHVF